MRRAMVCAPFVEGHSVYTGRIYFCTLGRVVNRVHPTRLHALSSSLGHHVVDGGGVHLPCWIQPAIKRERERPMESRLAEVSRSPIQPGDLFSWATLTFAGTCGR